MNRQAFAEVLQAPFSSLGRLQKFCKLHFPLWGICRSSASSIFPFGAFAGTLQTLPKDEGLGHDESTAHTENAGRRDSA